jgi:streptogramin lyase
MPYRRRAVACVSLFAALACSAEDDPPGEGSTAGSGGSGSAGGAECEATGTGRVEVAIRGLPDGVDADLTLAGPLGVDGVVAAGALELPAGPYVVTAARVADADPIVRTLYEYELSEGAFCLSAGETHSVEVDYAPIPTSHRLWTNNSNGTGNVLGFAAPSLAATASIEPTVSVVAGAGKDVTFDADGNLWAMGATVADPHLMRFSRSEFEASGEKVADRRIDIDGVPCLPALRAFAFDRDGALWVSVCGGQVVSLDASTLETSATHTPGVVLSNLSDNGDLAFDAAGNLWLTNEATIVRFDAARLAASSDEAPDATIVVRDTTDSSDLVPSNLAFDGAGNLWVIDFGGNVLSKLAAADLGVTGDSAVISTVSITLGVAALLERPALDESGGLWLALDQNRFGRLSPEQLLQSSNAGAPTTPATLITSPGMGYANRMAFYPAAATLPLHHRFP